MGTIVEEALEGDVPDDPLALAIPELAHRPGCTRLQRPRLF